ncbi:MAG TPA: hypothetical protein VF725_00575 [Ktedonobacterales bacterium]
MTGGMTSLFRAFRDGVSLGRRRAFWRVLTFFTIIKLAIFFAALALAWVIFAHAAGDALDVYGESRTYLLTQFLLWVVWVQIVDFSAGTSVVGPYLTVEAPRAYALALVHAAAARDEAVGKPTPLPPEPADAEATASEFGPLAHPMRTLGLDPAIYIVGIVAALLAVAAGVGFLLLFLQPSPYHPHPSLGDQLYNLGMPGFLILVGLGGLLWALTARHFARLERQTFTARVDDDGVIFQLPRGASGGWRFRWGEARAFLRMLTTDTSGYTHEVFVLSDGQREAIWEARYDGAAEGEPARVAAHRLAEMVARRTGLPLMDMTQTIAATLANNATRQAAVSWAIMARARAIAEADGDVALARELAAKLQLGGGPLVRLMARMRMRAGKPKWYSPVQRAETLRVARALLPHYPTPAEVVSSPGRLRLTALYWNAEFAFQFLALVVAVANLVVAAAVLFGG